MAPAGGPRQQAAGDTDSRPGNDSARAPGAAAHRAPSTPAGASDAPVRRPPELLAPAGDGEALRAALAAGADAVYLGSRRWSARAYAANFDERGLTEAVDRAHLWGARVYLTLNTLLKDAEVEPALAALEEPYRAGLDAVLVADIGLAGQILRRYPGLEVHASTQLGSHSSSQLALLARLGFSRAVLARELSLGEIGSLEAHGLDLEVFVHGALCYGYSGMCLFSSMVGGRSGNRGRCAQACRMRYRLLDPRRPQSPIAEGRVLSASDLAAIDLLPRLLRAGVRAFKIEGRMKDAAYVATTVEVYREALDAALADPVGYTVRPEWRERLEESFSRSFTAAHLEGRHDRVRSGGRGGHRGVPVGRVESLDAAAGRAAVRLSRPLSAGDAVTVYTARGQTDTATVSASASAVAYVSLQPGMAPRDRVFRVASAELAARAHELVSCRRVLHPERLAMRLSGRLGEPALLQVRPLGRVVSAVDGDRGEQVADELDGRAAGEGRGLVVEVASRRPLETARRAALDEARVRDALGALGGTPYELAALDLEVPADSFLPVGELKDMRRRAIAELETGCLRSRRRPPATVAAKDRPDAVVAPDKDEPSGYGGAIESPTALYVVLRLRPGDEPPAAPGVTAACLDVTTADDPAVVEAARRALAAGGLAVRCRPPAVLFDQDRDWWRAIARLPWQAVVARHAAHLESDALVLLEYPLVGLATGTVVTLGRLEKVRVSGVVLSPELTLDEIGAFAAGLGTPSGRLALEILAFGRQEVLPTRDRLGAAEDQTVRESRDPVDLVLIDGRGYEFGVTVERGGSRIVNARVTNLARHVEALSAAGVAGLVVEQAALTPDERRAFCREGIEGLAALADPARYTTAHLFRGVR